MTQKQTKRSVLERIKDETPDPTQQSLVERVVNFIMKFDRFGLDILGVILIALASMTFIGVIIPEMTGGLLRLWVALVSKGLGWGSVWLLIALIIYGFILLTRKRLPEPEDNSLNKGQSNSIEGVPTRYKFRWNRLLALEMAFFASLGLLALIGGMSISRAEAGQDGGIVGWGLAKILGLILNTIGLSGQGFQGVTLGVILIIGLVSGLGLWQHFGNKVRHQAQLSTGSTTTSGQLLIADERSEILNPKKISANPTGISRKKPDPLPAQYIKNFKMKDQEDPKPSIPLTRDERLPGFDLLVNEQANRPDERTINLTAGQIEKTLAEFGIPARVVGFRVGPTVTQFAVEPGFLEKEKNGIEGDNSRQKVRVAQIASLQRDLALALSAERLRIEAPVPGRPYVGIEVPNNRAMIVRLRSILESEAFIKVSSPLAIALGRDVSGQPVVTDLARMPHLLIAGTTGSGKSVCIASIAVCLIMNNTPEDLRLVMVDPKMVELFRFNGIPHLLGKVETDVETILVVLRWTVKEMERRYKLLEASHSRNIDSYNKKIQKKKGENQLPRIVVMIDELADLMMSAPDQTEHNLVRLAQMARAVGIHLIVATQRPSTDVVTGIIKANFPARISFTVASSIDSRVILDTVGAETLLGRGDMLFLPPDVSSPVRTQGVMVTDQEVDRVLVYWQQSMGQPISDEISPWKKMQEEESVLSDRDDLLDRAIEIVKGSQRASTSMLQRRLRIGYPRAARLMEELEDMGIVGPQQAGGKERDVFDDNE